METLTKEDLVVLTACTGELFTFDSRAVLNYCRDKLQTNLNIGSLALQNTYENVRDVAKDDLKRVIQKMNRQADNLCHERGNI